MLRGLFDSKGPVSFGEGTRDSSRRSVCRRSRLAPAFCGDIERVTERRRARRRSARAPSRQPRHHAKQSDQRRPLLSLSATEAERVGNAEVKAARRSACLKAAPLPPRRRRRVRVRKSGDVWAESKLVDTLLKMQHALLSASMEGGSRGVCGSPRGGVPRLIFKGDTAPQSSPHFCL
jgi:hypothetical protein